MLCTQDLNFWHSACFHLGSQSLWPSRQLGGWYCCKSSLTRILVPAATWPYRTTTHWLGHTFWGRGSHYGALKRRISYTPLNRLRTQLNCITCHVIWCNYHSPTTNLTYFRDSWILAEMGKPIRMQSVPSWTHGWTRASAFRKVCMICDK